MSATKIIPISAVIATRNRTASLARTLDSLLRQEILPAEFIVVDASDDKTTEELLARFAAQLCAQSSVRRLLAQTAGAAPQRNEGVAAATQPFIWFFDDDIIFEPDCVHRLWSAIEPDAGIGGVSAMILNQRYHPPGLVSRILFTIMHGKREHSFAGKVIGPAINILPEDRDDLPEVVPVEWLNTTCTIYRRAALPLTVFDSVFTGYSMMEDLALSLRVGREWRLVNARTARIVHESQSARDKGTAREFARMEVANRRYIMKHVLRQTGLLPLLRLQLWQSAHQIPRFLHGLMGLFGSGRFLGPFRASQKTRCRPVDREKEGQFQD